MSQRNHPAELRESAPVILPSMLMCDFSDLRSEIQTLEAAGVKALHLDVMDGHFVPNFTYGLTIVEAVRRVTDLPLDVHLMIERPGRYVERFIEAGADIVSIHIEAVDDARGVLQSIRAGGRAASLAVNPATPIESVEPLLDCLDMVLVMSVMPGFGGQEFDRVALDKLRWLRETTGPEFPLEIDGGVNSGTIRDCAAAGADLFVVGSAIFQNPNYKQTIDELAELAGVGMK